MTTWQAALAGVLIGLALVAMSAAVTAQVRWRSTYAQIHAGAFASVPGALFALAATAFSGDPALAFRGLLVAAFLVTTSPVASHALTRLEQHLRATARDRPVDRP